MAPALTLEHLCDPTRKGATNGMGQKGESWGSRSLWRYAIVRCKNTTLQDTCNTYPEERLNTSDQNHSLPKVLEGKTKKSPFGKSQNYQP